MATEAVVAYKRQLINV